MPAYSDKKKSKAQRIKLALDKLEKMQGDKSLWNTHWQTVAEYFLTRKANFTSTQTPGAFLNDEIFDGTGPGSLMKMASALIGMLWPNGAKSFVLERARGVKQTQAVKDYYERVTETLADAMDEPRAGLQIALDEYMIDQAGFGTSGISVNKGKSTKLSYKAENVKFMCIDEGPDGFVDTVYIVYEWTIRQVVGEYGLENLHEETQKLFKGNKEDQKIRILFCVQPRIDKEEGKEGIYGMDFETLHIEIDRKHLIREGGINELPTKVSRFRKTLGEIYGRSPAMEALPDVQELNAIWESVTIGIEKQIDPPLYMLDDGILGGNTIDTSAGALSVFNVSERAGNITDPIKPLFTVESIADSVGLIERLENKVTNHFMLDRLLDFNNESEMTLGEVNVRNRIRGFLIGSIFARQIAEVFSPLITRSFNLLYEMGELGIPEDSPEYQQRLNAGEDPEDILVIPKELLKRMTDGKGKLVKKPPFKIKYISPAARILQSEQAQGIVQTLDFFLSASQASPEAMDNIDIDAAGEILSFIYGAPSKILHSETKKESIRKGREEAMQEAQAAAIAPKAADAVEKIAKANSYGLMPKGSKSGSKKSAA